MLGGGGAAETQAEMAGRSRFALRAALTEGEVGGGLEVGAVVFRMFLGADPGNQGGGINVWPFPRY